MFVIFSFISSLVGSCSYETSGGCSFYESKGDFDWVKVTAKSPPPGVDNLNFDHTLDDIYGELHSQYLPGVYYEYSDSKLRRLLIFF